MAVTPQRLRGATVAALSMAAILIAPATAAAETPGDWTQFRGGPEQVGVNSAETTLSTANVGRLRQQWSSTLGGSVWSTPAVVDGTMYVASVDFGLLHAIDVASGATLWTAPDDALISDWTFTSPAVANGIVYLGINRPAAELWAFDAKTGAKLWSTLVSFSNINASPTVAEGVVYTAVTSGHVVAFDAATGSRLWETNYGSALYATPTFAFGLVVVASLDGRVSALKSDNGAVIWTFTTGGINASSVAVADRMAFLSSRDGNVYGLDLDTGTQRWRTRYGTNILATLQSSPAYANGIVYVGTNNDGRVLAIDAQTGRTVWSFRARGAVLSSPVVANGVVYVGSDDRRVYGLAASNGRRLWNATVSGAVDSGPVVSNGKVFAGTYGDVGGGNVYAFGLG